jgi:4a-hydroxytetrahydrobiopterin dehydratase
MWKIRDGKLEKSFQFENYAEAVGFINQIADIADEYNHHPDIFLYDYKKVKVYLVTHDASNTITNLDYQISEKIDAMHTTHFSK